MRKIADRVLEMVLAALICALLSGACSSNVVALEGAEGSSCADGTGKRCRLDTGELKCVSMEDPEFGCADLSTCAPCVVPHAASKTCSSGLCAVLSCQAGFQHCPGSTSSGCDSEQATDVYNCGMCGDDCEKLRMSTPTAVHVVSTKCDNAVCLVAVCEAGFSDCDGSLLSNGCETDAAIGCRP
jgi:hypothetical protein